MFRLYACYSIVLVLLGWSFARGQDQPSADYAAELPRIAPLESSKAQQAFELADGFEIELVASEPLVVDPIAFSFDARGRLFVIEMIDYSEQADESLGRVALLTDDDGDGVMDRRSTFAAGLSWPTAIHAWGDGVLVIAPPKLLFLRDRDGDGQCDTRELWYEGFQRNNVQGMANSLRWSVDGFIEGSSSTNGGDIALPDGSKLTLRGRDFRIDPLTKKMQATSGGGQHGMAFNRWGDKFVTSNSDHLQQIIDLEAWSARYGANVAMPAIRRSIAEDGPQAEVFRASPVEPWRIVRTRLRVSGKVSGPIEGGGRAAGYFTGATGTWIMPADSVFGDGEHDTAFVCDVGSNLVHRKRLISQGLFYTAQRLDAETEFLRSRDIWFRPVQLGDGPDGSLYIADMYREVIEHPLSLPPMIKQHLDLTSGRDRGRIWRVRSRGPSAVTSPDFTRLTNAELVQNLTSAVLWQRRTSHQLLIERQANDVSVPLEKIVRDGADPQSQLLALTALDRIGQLSPELLRDSLASVNARLVAKSILLAGEHHWLDGMAKTVGTVAVDDPHVQLELAKVLPQLPIDERRQLTAKLANSVSEPIVMAIMSSELEDNGWHLVEELVHDRSTSNGQALQAWLKLLLPIWAERLSETDGRAADEQKLRRLTDAWLDKGELGNVWIDALAQLPTSKARSILESLTAEQRDGLMNIIRRALGNAKIGNEATKVPERAVHWSRMLPFAELQNRLKDFINPRVENRLQLDFCQSLLWSSASKSAKPLIGTMQSMSPQLREAVLASMVSYRDSASVVAQAIIDGELPASYLSSSLQSALFAAISGERSELLKQVLVGGGKIDPGVMDQYLEAARAIPMGAEAKLRGQEIFRRECAACHRIRNIGSDVGPPLRQLETKSPEQLVASILDPNREVDSRYMAYVGLIDDGRVVSGVIQEESDSQIVFRVSGGERVVVLRSTLERLQTQGKSLMPTDLNLKISKEEMLDLIAFLMDPASQENDK